VSAAAAGSAAAAQAFTLYGGTIRRMGASVSGCATSAPTRRPARPYPFENVRPTMRFGIAISRSSSISVSPAKSA
jgi:hypothetical protein